MSRRGLPLPPLRTALLASLLVAAPAAADSWGEEINLTNSATTSETGLNHHPLALTPDGVLHVVWAEQDAPADSTFRIYTRCCVGATWTERELVVDYVGQHPGTQVGAKYPALAVAPDSVLHLFWHDYRNGGIENCEIYTKPKPFGAPWDTSQGADIRLTTTNHPETGGDNGYVPVPLAAADGTLHVLWYDYRHDGQAAEIFSKTRPAGGEWDLTPGDSADTRVTFDDDHSELVAADLDRGGDLHAAWRSVGAGARIFYAVRDAETGLWSDPVDIGGASTVGGAPALVVDADDAVHVVWPDSRDGGRALFTRVREAGGTWSAIARLTRPADGADEPTLACDESGTLHLVWHDGRHSLLNREVFHREKSLGASWDTTYAADTRISNAPGSSVRPSVLARGGCVHILWKDARSGANDVYYRARGSFAARVPETAPAHPRQLLAWPNPCRGGEIHFARADRRALEIVAIHDVAGRRLRVLRVPGPVAVWDARDSAGRPLPAGVYFARVPGVPRAVRLAVLR
jgi:hypothetical protein